MRIALVGRRTLSTATSHFLPSVSFLLHKHSISPETAASIAPTGPKGRLLKGDVLAFIHDPSSAITQMLDTVFNEVVHSVSVDMQMANRIRPAAQTDIVISACVAALSENPKVHSIWSASAGQATPSAVDRVSATRVDASGDQASVTIDINPDVKVRDFANKFQVGPPTTVPAMFSVVDWGATQWAESPTVHLTHGESGILSISRGEQPILEQDDIMDYLTGAKPKPTKRVSPQASTMLTDDFEGLSAKRAPANLLNLELVSDGRAITAKNAIEFLQSVKRLVEQSSHNL